jgi:hypothetical protein
MSFERFLNKGRKPSKEEIKKAIGERLKLWLGIHQYIEDNYDFTQELVFFTKKYGWAVRYRRQGRTMVYVFPEQHAFSVLLVLSKKESDEVELIKDKLNAEIKTIFNNTEQLHDGRWLWIRSLTDSDLDSIKLLLNVKRKPKI